MEGSEAELQVNQRDWNTLAELDPLWAVLSLPGKRSGQWDLEEFFETGRQEVEQLLRESARLELPKNWDRLLDFGCGVGRLTRAFAPHFRECVGVDISEVMLAKAHELNKDAANCRFVLNTSAHLAFESNTFDLVYTDVVLQHQPHRTIIESYIEEFVRVLRPGGLIVFQLPCAINWIYRFRIRRRLYQALRALGCPHSLLHHRLGLTTMLMQSVPVESVRELLTQQAAEVVLVNQRSCGGYDSATYFATKHSSVGVERITPPRHTARATSRKHTASGS